MATNISFSTYGFMNGILILSEENWRTFFKPFITDSVQNGLATIEGANMTVYVSAGECRCGAVMGILDEMIALDIANSDSTYDRIDSVVVQYTYGEPSTLAVAIVQGTPSANPVPPTLTKVYDTLWQMEIAQILVPSGATSSSEFTITDKRVIYESIESIIDDNTESEDRVWSSQKTHEEIVSLSTEIYDSLNDSLNSKANVITRTVSGDIVTIENNTDNSSIFGLSVGIDPVQAGSGDPSPDNVRPISGHSTAVITRTGINIWDEEWETGTIRNDNGQDSSSDTSIRFKNYVSVKPETTYRYVNGSGASGAVHFYNESKTQLSVVSVNTSNAYTFTTPATCAYIRYNTNTSYGGTYLNDISINYPSTDTVYHAGHVQTVTIDLDGTRYGGVLDVPAGTLTVDRVYEEFDGSADETWTTEYVNGTYPRRFGIILQNNVVTSHVITNLFKLYAWGVRDFTCDARNNKFYACLETTGSVMTVADFKTWLASNNLQVVYELATPVTVTLTPATLSLLKGENNLWASTGDILDLTYPVESKSFIDEQIAESQIKTRQMITIVTDQMIAPDNLNISDIVVVNDELYKATANIASGEAMVIGTNVIKITLAEYIQSLL